VSPMPAEFITSSSCSRPIRSLFPRLWALSRPDQTQRLIVSAERPARAAAWRTSISSDCELATQSYYDTRRA
jgi:hypothetical protein